MGAESLPRWNGGHSIPLLFDPCTTPIAVSSETFSFSGSSSNKPPETRRIASTRLSLSRDHAALHGEAPTLVVLVPRRSSSDLRWWSQSVVQIEAERGPSRMRRLRIRVAALNSWRGEGGNDGDDLGQAGLGFRNTDTNRMRRTNRRSQKRDSTWHNNFFFKS